MAVVAFVCGLLMAVGGALLMLNESVTLGALSVLAGLGLLGFGAWVLRRERAHRHRREELGAP